MVHDPLAILQRKVYVPAVNPVIVVVGDVAVVIVAAAPLTCVHNPVPLTAVLAVMVTDEAHKFLSTPAFAVVGSGSTVTTTCLALP